MTPRDCVVGVDGGGTTTIAQVAALDGSLLGDWSAGGSNWESIGVDAAVAAVAVAVRGALSAAGRAPGDVVAAAFGLAGVDWPSDAVALHQALGALSLAGERWVDNDVIVALRAGCRAGWGIVSNVGTGTVTAGRNRDGHVFRTMAVGWGEPSGASGLARDALHAIAAAHHGTGPHTALTALVLEAAGATEVAELFEQVSRHHLRPRPAWAPLIGRAATAGDEVAQRILTVAGERHGAMVAGVAERLSMRGHGFEVALTGGIHRARDPWFAPAFAGAVETGCPGATLTVLDALPVEGAVLIALDIAARQGGG